MLTRLLRPAERLLPDDGPGGLVVHVEVARGRLQHFGALVREVPVKRRETPIKISRSEPDQTLAAPQALSKSLEKELGYPAAVEASNRLPT